VAGASPESGVLAVDAAARLLSQHVEGLGLTPAERAEALCLALGVPCEASAAARGISARAIRARRRRILEKLSLGALRPDPPPPGLGVEAPGAAQARPPAGREPAADGARTAQPRPTQRMASSAVNRRPASTVPGGASPSASRMRA
jgi:DNA-binding CsgD family transcriptional regulator